jgi:hypothetical protein
MSTAAWVFLVGFRVFDLGALVAWLVWFSRHSDEPDDDLGDDLGGGGGSPPGPEGPPPIPRDGIPLPDAGPWPVRRRDHGSFDPVRRPARRAPDRRPRPQRAPVSR